MAAAGDFVIAADEHGFSVDGVRGDLPGLLDGRDDPPRPVKAGLLPVGRTRYRRRRRRTGSPREDLARIEPFGVEMWMNEYETRCAYNLAETCVESLTVAQLLDIVGARKCSPMTCSACT